MLKAGQTALLFNVKVGIRIIVGGLARYAGRERGDVEKSYGAYAAVSVHGAGKGNSAAYAKRRDYSSTGQNNFAFHDFSPIFPKSDSILPFIPSFRRA